MPVTYPVAYYTDEQDTAPKTGEATWEQLVEAFSRPRRGPCTTTDCAGKGCPHKSGPAWSPVQIEGSRRAANVRAVTLAVFDLDVWAPAAVGAVVSRYRCVLHTTHSHRPDAPRMRLILPLARPVPGDVWPTTHRALVEMLGIPADPVCRDASRLYFLPSAPIGAEYESKAFEGKLLEPPVLALVGSNSISLHDTQSLVRSNVFVGSSADLTEARAKLTAYTRRANVPKINKELVRRVLSGQPLAEPGNRDVAVNTLASIMAFALASLPVEGAIELVRDSVAGMFHETGEDWLDKFRYSYKRACERREDARAREEAFARGVRAVLVGSNEIPETDESWRELLTIDGRSGRPEATESNLYLLFKHAAGDLRWDVVKDRLEARSGPFVCVPPRALGVRAAMWLETHGVRVSPARAEAALVAVALSRPYDPVREYLESLTWDGTPRINTWLETYLGASGDFQALVGRKWLISAVARGLNPGVQADSALILEGPQGTGKTTAARILAGDWFDSLGCALGDKESRQHAMRAWIVELSELSAVKRSDIETLKGFLTDTVDRYRPPYGRAVEEFPRRCVFIGTTNAPVYLRDPTGHRRWWPVRVGVLDREGLVQDRDQLFAEAVVAYRAGERHYLEGDEEVLAAAETSERVEDSDEMALAEHICEWFASKDPKYRPVYVTTRQVALECLKMEAKDFGRGMSMRVGSALRQAGFERKKVNRRGSVEWGYFPPEELRHADVGNMVVLRAVEGAKATKP